MNAVLITGGSRGIGAAMVRAFTEKGCQTAFFYKENCEAAEKISRETGALALQCDVSDAEQTAEAVRNARIFLGVPYFDVVVLNAGISTNGIFTDITEKQWNEMINVNLFGYINVTKETVPAMVDRQCGSIVMVSSVWGQTGASCETAYSAAKAAVIGLSKSLAKELGPSGIRVNCIAPGVIDTEMNSSYSQETMQSLAEEIPMGRIGKPEEAAKAVVFLASEDASYITGQVLAVNGGFYI